jgi:hypothetical protein
MRTILILFPQCAHVGFEAAVKHSTHRMYRAGRGSATWLITPACRVWPVAPVILCWKGILALRRVGREQVEALCRRPRGSGRGHDGGSGAGRGCSGGRGMGGQWRNRYLIVGRAAVNTWKLVVKEEYARMRVDRVSDVCRQNRIGALPTPLVVTGAT